MAKRGVKKQDHERLDDPTISRVISLLNAEKPITKKAACEILNISYNTKRLQSIIDEYIEKIEYRKKRLKDNRGKPYSDYEIRELIVDYLSGSSITQISQSLYRTVGSIKKQIEKLHLPERDKSQTYKSPGLIPDEAISDTFTPGTLVWASRYNAVAEIMAEYGTDSENNKIYRIYVFGKHNQSAYQPAYQLGNIPMLQELEREQFQHTEKPNFAYRID